MRAHSYIVHLCNVNICQTAKERHFMGTQIFLGEPPANIKDWIEKQYCTIYKVQTTSSYKNTGIYSAERNDASKPVKIDWGDGTVETVDGNVS